MEAIRPTASLPAPVDPALIAPGAAASPSGGSIDPHSVMNGTPASRLTASPDLGRTTAAESSAKVPGVQPQPLPNLRRAPAGDPGGAWLDTLRTAERAARAAASHLMAGRSKLALAFLSRKTPLEQLASLTEEAHDLIRDEIGRRFHGHEVLGRSDGRPAPGPGSGAVWLVEALDGSAAFLADRRGWAVSIALVVDGTVRVGVVVDLIGGFVYRALAGAGAERLAIPGTASPDHPPRMRLMPSARRHLGDCRASTQFPLPGSRTMAVFSREFGRASQSFASVGRHPSIALALAQVASGEADACWFHLPHPCTTAAGCLLLQEAGASLRARDGADVLHSRSIAACAPGLAYDFHALLAGL